MENLRRLLEAIAASGPLPPVFIKIRVPFDSIDSVLRITDDYPFVRGFRVNTHNRRPYVGLNTPASTWEAMTGALTSPAIGLPAMLESVREWYVRANPARYALVASGGIRSGRDAYAAFACRGEPRAVRDGAGLSGAVAGTPDQRRIAWSA